MNPESSQRNIFLHRCFWRVCKQSIYSNYGFQSSKISHNSFDDIDVLIIKATLTPWSAVTKEIIAEIKDKGTKKDDSCHVQKSSFNDCPIQAYLRGKFFQLSLT